MNLQLISSAISLDGEDLLKPESGMICGDSVYASGFIYNVVSKLRQARIDEKMASDKVRGLESQIKKYMGDQENLIDNSEFVLCSYKACKSNRLDSLNLKKSYPDVYDAFVVETESRRFLIK